jgi:hypothetical protein
MQMIPKSMKTDRPREKTIDIGEVMSRRLIIFLGVLFIFVALVSTSVLFKVL